MPLFVICFSLLVLTSCSQKPTTNDLKFVDVFQHNDGHYPEYRIPALATSNEGTLLAFCEGRERSSDHAENDIVLKRSLDNGATWGEAIVVFEDGANVAVNPTAVVLPSGRILLMFQHFPANWHARPMDGGKIKLLNPGVTGEFISKTFLMHSDDDGLTWSEPRDVTEGTKRPELVNSTATGPGVGIVLTRGDFKGRIIMPTNEGIWDKHLRDFSVYACFSDDDGETWQYGDNAPNGDDGKGNEVQMVELADGSILLNSRSIYGAKVRKQAISKDGGITWSPLKDNHDLIEPQCMGSIVRHRWPEEGGSILLYSGPATQDRREKGAIFISQDEGKTWPERKEVYAGGFAYSCLTVLPDGSVGLLFEADGYKSIKFVRIQGATFVKK